MKEIEKTRKCISEGINELENIKKGMKVILMKKGAAGIGKLRELYAQGETLMSTLTEEDNMDLENIMGRINKK